MRTGRLASLVTAQQRNADEVEVRRGTGWMWKDRLLGGSHQLADVGTGLERLQVMPSTLRSLRLNAPVRGCDRRFHAPLALFILYRLGGAY